MIPRLIRAFHCVCHVLSWLASSTEHSRWHLLKQKTEKWSSLHVCYYKVLSFYIIHLQVKLHRLSFQKYLLHCFVCIYNLILIYFDSDSDTDIWLKSQMLTGFNKPARFCSGSLLSAPAHQPISQATLNDKLALITAAWCNLWVLRDISWWWGTAFTLGLSARCSVTLLWRMGSPAACTQTCMCVCVLSWFIKLVQRDRITPHQPWDSVVPICLTR